VINRQSYYAIQTSDTGEKQMTILVTFASRSGSTVGIAEAVGETLRQQGIAVDVRPMSDVEDVAAYQAIVLGSAIRQEKWLPEAMQFIQTHQVDLEHKPVATFLVCMALATDNATRYERGLQSAKEWMRPVRELIHPLSEGYFAGALNLGKIKELHFRIVLSTLVMLGLFPKGDHRDWDAIEQWADGLPEQLLQMSTAHSSLAG